MHSRNKALSLLFAGCLLSGCDSNYHAFDGQSGYQFEVVSNDQYKLAYIGHPLSNMKDVEVMWHHTARELCRGGAYQHLYQQKKVQTETATIAYENSLVPKQATHYQLSGELTCLAPTYGVKQGGAEVLAGSDLTTDELVSGRTANENITGK